MGERVRKREKRLYEERKEINECSVYSQCSVHVCYLYFTQQRESNKQMFVCFLGVVYLHFMYLCVCMRRACFAVLLASICFFPLIQEVCIFVSKSFFFTCVFVCVCFNCGVCVHL